MLLWVIHSVCTQPCRLPSGALVIMVVCCLPAIFHVTFFVSFADSLLSFLDLLATTFPGKTNRASFRSLATDLRRDPSLNEIAR